MRRLLLALVGLLVASATPAFARSIRIERLEIDLEVRADGSVVAEETIHVRFEGKWNGIYRVLPLPPEGAAEEAALTLTDVTDAKGTPLETKVEIVEAGTRWKIRVPGAEDAIRVVRLRYEMQAVLPPTGRRVLRWDVVGHAWEMPLDLVRVRVRLPAGTRMGVARARTGTVETPKFDVRRVRADATTLVMQTTRTLAPGEGFGLLVPILEGPPRPRIWRGLVAVLKRTWPLWLVLLPLPLPL